MHNENRNIEISWAALWRIVLFVVIIAILYQGRQILLGLFLAIIISSGIESVVDTLEQRIRLPRSVSVILIFLAVLFILIILIYTVLPIAILELNTVFAGVNKANL